MGRGLGRGLVKNQGQSKDKGEDEGHSHGQDRSQVKVRGRVLPSGVDLSVSSSHHPSRIGLGKNGACTVGINGSFGAFPLPLAGAGGGTFSWVNVTRNVTKSCS